MKQIIVRSSKHKEFVDITREVKTLVSESGVENGICVVFCPHTTAAITINENADRNVLLDINSHLSEMVPRSSEFRHKEGNSDGHIKSSLFGPSVTLIVDNEELVLGTWQAIYFCEFDGPRTRNVYVKLIHS